MNHLDIVNLPQSVMWSETKKSILVFVLALQVLCCVMKHNLVTLIVMMIVEDTAAL